MGRAPCCDKANVKKGPWSPEEDARLKSYIDQHGTGGNWIALPQKIGLKRCGKSCRLRWLNYLRPNLKHGGFSDQEDHIICSLYLSIGSRWSIIAAQLPGRTDNDIKNYWNTRLKKKLLGSKHHRKSNDHSARRTNNTFLKHSDTPPPMLPPPDHHDHMMMMDHHQQEIAAAAHQYWLPGSMMPPLPPDMLVKLQGSAGNLVFHNINDNEYDQNQYNNQQQLQAMMGNSTSTTSRSPNSSVSMDSSFANASSSLSSILLFQDQGSFPAELGMENDDNDDQLAVVHNPLELEDDLQNWYVYDQQMGDGSSSSERTGKNVNPMVGYFDPLLQHLVSDNYSTEIHAFLPPLEHSTIYFSPPQ